MDFMKLGEEVLNQKQTATLGEKLRVGAKLMGVSMVTALGAPITYPWGMYRYARCYGMGRPVAALAAVFGAASVPFAPGTVATAPLVGLTPFVSTGVASCRVAEKRFSQSKDPLAKLFAWAYRF